MALSTKTLLIAGGITSVGAVGTGATYLAINNKEEIKGQVQSEEEKEPNIIPPKVVDTQPATEKPITELLEEAGVKLLGEESGDDVALKNNWSKFIESYDRLTDKNEWNFSNWETVKQDKENTTEFKKKCSENSQKKALNKDNSLFKTVKEYCTKSISKPS